MLRLLVFIALFFGLSANAASDTPPNYHAVGWLNTFVPGAGEFLLGDYTLGATQAALEVSSFWIGYNMAGRNSLTLDGIPESLPSPDLVTLSSATKKSVCIQRDSTGKCTKFRTVTTTKRTTTGGGEQDISTPLIADILQEFGIKYHMVNVFNSYREAAKANNVTENIDQTSTKDLFLAPFNPDVITDPWVWAPLAITGGALVANYLISIKDNAIAPVAKFKGISNPLYAFNYALMYPTGSGAPEEMFYRGFLQNEFQHVVDSPYFSITASTLAYAFSHSVDERPTAAVTGLFLGFLTYREHGQLSKGIAYHFWADLMAGIAQLATVRYAQSEVASSSSSPATILFQTEF